MLDVLVSAVQASALPVWILGGAVTASGRILADVHWYGTPGLSRVVHEILAGILALRLSECRIVGT